MNAMIGDPPWTVKGDMLIDANGTHMLCLVEQPGLGCDKKTILAQIAAAPEMLDLLLVALPYVEDALDDPAFKKGSVRRHVNRIRTVVSQIDEQ